MVSLLVSTQRFGVRISIPARLLLATVDGLFRTQARSGSTPDRSTNGRKHGSRRVDSKTVVGREPDSASSFGRHHALVMRDFRVRFSVEALNALVAPM